MRTPFLSLLGDIAMFGFKSFNVIIKFVAFVERQGGISDLSQIRVLVREATSTKGSVNKRRESSNRVKIPRMLDVLVASLELRPLMGLGCRY